MKPEVKRQDPDIHRIALLATGMRSALGISRLADITGLDIAGVPVVQAVRPMSRSNSVSQGKGGTLAEAVVSAVFEAAESFFAERVDRLETRVASAQALGAADGWLENHLQEGVPAHWGDWDLAWTMSMNLLGGPDVPVPLELVHTAYVVPPLPYDGVFKTSSTGLAVAVSKEQAVLHGLLEVIERDGLARMAGIHGFLHRHRIDATSIDHVELRETIVQIESRGFRIGLWHVPSPFGVPVISCHLMERAEPRLALLPQPSAGSAAHPDAAVAALAAIREAAQSRLTAISGARDDFGCESYPKYPDYDLLDAHSQLLAHARGSVAIDRIPTPPGATVPDICDSLARRGIDRVCQVSLETQPLAELQAVKVFVPGLQPFYE